MPKSKSIFKAFKSSFGPLLAPGSPTVASHSGTATPTTSIMPPATTHDLVLNNLATACRITKDVAEALNQVPYIKAVTGVVAQIIKIREEVEGNRERCDEIISMVEKYAYTVIGCLVKLYSVKGEHGLESLKSELESFQSHLENILLNDLEPLKNRSRWKAYANRDKDAEEMKRIERELKGFVDRFMMEGVTEGVSAAEATKSRLSQIQQQAILGKRWLRSQHAQYNIAIMDASLGSIDMAQCAPGTRKPILERITTWACDKSPDSPAVFWMVGEGGAGKSTIARTIAETFDGDDALPSVVTFFCSRKFSDTNQQVYIIPTIAYQLARLSESYSSELLKDPKIVDSLGLVPKQMNSLLVQPWEASSSHRVLDAPPFIVIIDALDEIVSQEQGNELAGGFAFLKSLLKAIEQGHLSGLKIFITSRPNPELSEVCRSLSSEATCHLYDIPKNEVEEDIYRYLQYRLPKLQKPADHELLKHIATKADGLFIFASTAVLIANPTSGTTMREQRQALQGLLDGIPLGSTTSPVNDLYAQVLSDAFEHRNGTALSSRLELLHTIICTEDRVSVDVLVNLMSDEPDDQENIQEIADDLIHRLHAVLCISDGRITWHHASFLDFMLSPASASITHPGKGFNASCDVHLQHANLARRCFYIMRSRLKFNICQLPSSSLLDSEVDDLATRVEDNIPHVLRYTCRYWAIHTSKVQGQDMHEDIERFLNQNLLFWIEVMNLVQQSNLCATLLNIAQQYVAQNCPDAIDLRRHLSAASHFSTVFKGSHASKSTPHLYLSSLVYAGSRFPLLQRWQTRFTRFPTLYTRGVGTQLLMTLNGHTSTVASVALSSDDARIVSGSYDNSVRVWDVETGEELVKLEGHTSWVNSVAFSHENSRIASGASDDSVRVWDAKTGREIRKLEGHTGFVNCAAFSYNDSLIVSGSADRSVRVWDAETGEEIKRLDGHTDWVRSVTFSSDGSCIASGSDDRSVRLWNVEMGEELSKLEGHTGAVNSVVFSSDGTRIASGSSDRSVRVWHFQTGEEIKRLGGHTGSVYSIAISSDGARIVSGSSDYSVRVWDIEMEKEICKLDGHTASVTSVALSTDGSHIVSSSSDHSVRVWDVDTGVEINEFNDHTDPVNSISFSSDESHIVSSSSNQSQQVWHIQTNDKISKLDGHADSVYSVALSSDSSRIVSGSGDRSVCVWDVETGEEVKRLDGHTGGVTSVAFTSDGSRIASGSRDQSVRLWDVQTGVEIRRFDGHAGYVYSISFSPDGSYIVSGSIDRSVRVWDIDMGVEIKKLEGHTGFVNSVAFSSDGFCIVSGSEDHSVRSWNVKTGEEIKRLDGHTRPVNSAVFSPDSSRIVSGSSDRSLRVWNAETGEEIKKLDGHTDWVRSVAFSSDGSYIVSSSDDKSVRLWDVEAGAEIQRLNGHTDFVYSVALSSDGSRIVSGSDDHSIRVWDVSLARELQKLNHSTPNVNSTASGDENTLGAGLLSSAPSLDQLNWTVDDDGWIVQLPVMNKIMWLPDTLTRYLYRPANTLMISPQTVTLDLAGIAFGTNWSLCYQQS